MKTGSSLLYSKRNGLIQYIDKQKTIDILLSNKLISPNEAQNVIESISYEDLIKIFKKHLKEAIKGIYAFNPSQNKDIVLFILLDKTISDFKKYLKKNYMNEETAKKLILNYIMEDTRRKERFSDIEICTQNDNDEANSKIRKYLSAWDLDKCNKFIDNVINGNSDICENGYM